MKSKLLPLSLFTLILGLTSIILAAGFSGIPEWPSQKGDSSAVSTDYFNKIRMNQITGRIDAADAVKARQQSEALALKSGNSLNLNWETMGPDNAPGVVRAMVYDNQAESNTSLILAGVTGGIWRTNNLGATWTKLNAATQNLKVSCMAQADDGTIYAGTGDGFCLDDVQYSQDNIYYGGIVGEGIFKSTDQDNFLQLEATKPIVTGQNDTVDFAYIFDIAIDNTNDRVYAATNTGLFYSDNKGDAWNKVTRHESDSTTYGVTMHIDTTLMVDSLYFDETSQQWEYNQVLETLIDTTLFETVVEGKIEGEKVFGFEKCDAVEVGTSGVVMATFKNKVYVSDGGVNPLFTNVSGNPYNIDMLNMHINYYTTNLTLIDTNNQTYNRSPLTYIDTTSVLYAQQTYFWTQVSNPVSPYSQVTNIGNESPQGRTQVAIAPSDDNVFYAVSSTAGGYMENMYLSNDRGQTWEIIFPGGATSSLKPFDGTSCYNMVLTVFPDNPYKVLLGGDDLWIGKQLTPGDNYSWGAGPFSQGFVPQAFNYLPSSHHNYVFQPGSSSKFAVAANIGIAFATLAGNNAISFQQIVRGLSNTQVYTLGISGQKNKFIVGVESNGLQYVSGEGNTPETGTDISFGGWSSTGGACKMSVINPAAFMLSDNSGFMNRTSDFGLSWSTNFTAPQTSLNISTFKSWENFNDHNSKTTVKFIADTTYYYGDRLLCHSANKGFESGKGYPFTTVLEQDSLVSGDSIYVKDIVQSKFFIATHDAVYMTRSIVKFSDTITWASILAGRKNLWKILKTNSNYSKPSCLGLSADANYLFVGTENGRIYRIANIQDTYDKSSGDIDSPFCVLAIDEIIPDTTTHIDGRYITSISVDPQNPAHLLITLGNYGNESYVFRSMNALAENAEDIVFTDITGDPEAGGLPRMPIYSSIIEMHNSNVAAVGTEYGVFSTQNLTSENPEWVIDDAGIGKAMVVRMEQQTTYKGGVIIHGPDATTPPLVYPSVNNYGDIYCATFGRGVFRDESFHQAVGVPEIYTEGHQHQNTISVEIYPNPVQGLANVSFDLKNDAAVTIKVNDIAGKVVKNIKLNTQAKGNNNYKVDCSDLKSGLYILNLQVGNTSQSTKFIVK